MNALKIVQKQSANLMKLVQKNRMLVTIAVILVVIAAVLYMQRQRAMDEIKMMMTKIKGEQEQPEISEPEMEEDVLEEPHMEAPGDAPMPANGMDDEVNGSVEEYRHY